MSLKPPLSDDLWAKTPADVQVAILPLFQSFESRIAALEARINQNSSNSSKPPSAGIHRSRGHDGLKALLGEDPGGHQVVISDRFPTYDRVSNRQLCWAHLRRDFQAMIDRGGGGELVGRKLLDQSRWIFTWWDRLAEGSIARTTLRSSVSGLKRVVGHLLREGVACACPWTKKVCRKILSAEKHLWRFAEVEGVVPDNNAAERALRHGVIWRKLSLGTASEAGSRFVERLLSVVETCRQNGRSVASYLTACFEAKRSGQPIPSPLA